MIGLQGRRGKFVIFVAVFISVLLFTFSSNGGHQIQAAGHRIQTAGHRWRHGSSASLWRLKESLKPNVVSEGSVQGMEATETAVIEAGSTLGSSSQETVEDTGSTDVEVLAPTEDTPAADTTNVETSEAITSNDNPGEEAQQSEDEQKDASAEEEIAEPIEISLTDFEVATYVEAIMTTPDESSLERLPCRASIGARYTSLRTTSEAKDNGKIRYFFALDLYEVLGLLPTLIGAIIQVMRFLGPSSCALAIVEGRSKDGMPAVLEALKDEMEALGATYHYITSDINPLAGDRMGKLADLRNEALAPLTKDPKAYSADANIIFLNDVGICPHDILELLYQHSIQRADMTCGMDWFAMGESFYDVYIARSMVGETFFQIAQDGLWTYSKNLFWADRASRRKFVGHHPFQVYACWNGGAVISAAPVIKQRIAFRKSLDGECFMGEPTLFCKDLWKLNMGRIQVVPTVNVGYATPQLNATQVIKDQHGWVEDHVDVENDEPQVEMVEWQKDPPELVKCMVAFDDPYWVPST